MTSSLRRLSVLVATFLLMLAGSAAAAPADDLREAQKLYSQGKMQPALEKIDGYLKAQPREPQGRFLKGLVLTEQKKVNEAIQVFTGLTEDFPELPEPYNNLAVLYASQGNYDKAKSALELAIHTHPTYGTAHENLGDIYAQLASRAYDRALQLDKGNTTAQLKLAMVKDIFVSPKVAAAARGEPAKVAKAEPAKVEPAAKATPTKAEAGKPDAGKAEVGKVEPAKTAAAPTPPGDEGAAVASAVAAWAAAWDAKNVKDYLGAYAPDFVTPGRESREAWEKMRTERIQNPKSIEVKLSDMSISVSGETAKAKFRQYYRSDVHKSTVTKTLDLVKVGGKWLIKQERSGG